jgi:FkbM family methyltransferase
MKLQMTALAKLVLRPLQKFLRSRGLRLAKAPSAPMGEFPVFDLVISVLRNLKGDSLFFVQVGANDAGPGDPIVRYASRLPWSGILIEPQPDVFALLKRAYCAAPGKLTFENVAVGPPQKKELVLYRAAEEARKSPQYSHERDSKLVSCDPTRTSSGMQIANTQLEAFTVPCRTLDELLEKNGVTSVDILLIDTEGFDDQVLRSLSLGKIAPLIIRFEHGHLSVAAIDASVHYLNEHGYTVLYGGEQHDTIAVHAIFLSLLQP